MVPAVHGRYRQTPVITTVCVCVCECEWDAEEDTEVKRERVTAECRKLRCEELHDL